MSEFSPEEIDAELNRRAMSSPKNGQDYSSNPHYQELSPYVSEVEKKYNLPSGLLSNTAGAESSWNPSAVNPDTGATGLMQFMPSTAKQFGIDPKDPHQSIDAAGKYYQHLISKNNGDVEKAAAQYGGFVTKDPSDYQSKIIPQGYYAQNQQPVSPQPQPEVQSDASPFSNEEIEAELARREALQPAEEEARGEFNKGLHRSISGTANLMMNALPAFGKSAVNELFGTDFDNSQNLKDYAASEEEMQKKYGASVAGVTDIKSAGDVLPYLKGIAGENIAGLIPIMGEGYLGAKLLAPAMSEMAEKAAAKYMAKGLAEDVAKKKAEQEIAAKAATLSVLGAMAPQEMAGEYMNLMSKGHDDPMGAALIGGLETAVYALPGMEIFNKVFKGPQGAEAVTKAVTDGLGAATRSAEQQTRLRAMQDTMVSLKAHPAVQEAMKTAGYLGAAGMASESIGVLGEGLLGANPDILSKDNFARIVNSGVSQAIGGALVGGGLGAIQHGAKPKFSFEVGDLPGANKEAGVTRTTLDTGEVQVKRGPKSKDAAEGEQYQAAFVSPEGVPVENANPVVSNLSDPSILRPSQMRDEHHILADKYGITTEDLRFAIDHLKTDEEKTAALDNLFKTLKPSIDPKQAELDFIPPTTFEGRVSAIMKQRPELDRAYAEVVVQKQDQIRQDARNKALKEEGAEFSKNGTLVREVKAEDLKNKKIFNENPENKIGVHDHAKAAKALDEAVSPIKNPYEVTSSDLEDLALAQNPTKVHEELVNRAKVMGHDGLKVDGKIVPFEETAKTQRIGATDFASKAASVVKEKGNPQTAAQWAQFLEGKLGKEIPFDEVKYTGLLDMLKSNPELFETDSKGRISPEHLAEQFGKLPVSVETKPATQYHNFTLESRNGDHPKDYRISLLKWKKGDSGQSVSQHFGKDVIAHWRTTAIELGGKATDFIQELQSDWHQARQRLVKKELENLIKDRKTIEAARPEIVKQEAALRKSLEEQYPEFARTENVFDLPSKEKEKLYAYKWALEKGVVYPHNLKTDLPEFYNLLKKTAIQSLPKDFGYKKTDTVDKELHKQFDKIQQASNALASRVHSLKDHIPLKAGWERIQNLPDEIAAHEHSRSEQEIASGRNTWFEKFIPLSERRAVEDGHSSYTSSFSLIEKYVDSLHATEKARKELSNKEGSGIPDAPFKTSWSEIALKDAITKAIHAGKEAIALPRNAAVKKIQGHGESRETHKFYEERLINDLKNIQKKVPGLKWEVKKYNPKGFETPTYEQFMEVEKFFKDARDGLGLGPEVDRGPHSVDAQAWLDAADRIDNHFGSSRQEGQWKLAHNFLDQLRRNKENRDWDSLYEKAGQNLGSETYDLTQITWPKEFADKVLGGDRLAILQKSSDYPVTGNYLHDIATPIRVAKNMSFIKLSEGSKPVFTKIIKALETITKEVSGSAAKFAPVRQLLEDGFQGRIAGAQVAHMVMTAMPDYYASHPLVKEGRIPTELIETTYHENAHLLFNHVFSEGEKSLIRANAEKLRPYFMKDGWLSQQDFDAFLANSHPSLDVKNPWAGVDELFANMVGKEGAKRAVKAANQMQDVPFSFKQFAKRIMDWTDRAQAAIRQAMGKQTFDDLVNSVFEGKYARDHINDAMSEIQRARVADIAANFQRQNQDEHTASMNEALKQSAGPYNGLEKSRAGRNDFNGSRDTNPKSMGLIGRFISSFRYLADKHDFVAPAYNDYIKAQERGQAFMQGFSSHLNNGLNQLPKADRYLVSDIVDAVSKSEGKIRFNSEGHAMIPYDSSSMKDLPFSKTLKDGDIVPLKDVELSKGIKALQDAYSFTLKQREDYWREYVSKSFEEQGLKPNFSKADVEAAKARLDKEDPFHQRKVDTLDSIISDLSGLDKMKKQEYVPRQRYGQFAYVVKHRATKENLANGKAGKTAGLFTVEDGFFNKQFDTNSMSKAHGNIKKYLARPDLYNVYDTKGRISHDKVTKQHREISNPFILTHDNIKSHYGLTGDNLSIMAGLLNSRDVDMNKYNQLRDMLTTGINHDKFSRMFKPSEKLDGYSRDWDRVIHSYASTSAHFLGNMEFNRNLPEYQNIFSKVEDNGLRDRLQNHFGKPGERGYINSGSSDWGHLRAANYLWCMGGNISSMLVETMRTPTATLGNLTQFNPNLLQNMATIGKYGKRYYTALDKIIKNRAQFGGNLVTPLKDETFLNHMFHDDKEMAGFIRDKAANYANIAEANNNRTYGGGDMFGSETGKSAFLSKTNKIQTWLSNPLSVAEQGSRLISFCSNYKTMRDLEKAQPGKLDRLFQNNEIYKDLRERNPDWEPWQAGAMYMVDEENGASGKIGRAPYLQSVGGAFLVPFYSFTQAILESSVKMFNRGPEGRRALGTMMGMVALTSGIMGLPGVRFGIKAGQGIQNAVEGTDYDWQQAIRENAAGVIGERPSLMLTNGILRAYGGMEISQRIGIPLPGEELMLSLMGADAGKTSDVLGIEGAMLQNASNSWRAYMNGQSLPASLGQMLPNAFSNVSKAYQLTQRGAMSNLGGSPTRAVPPDQLSNWSVISRALGITSDQIASANEQIYSQKMAGKELQSADRRFNQQASMAYMLQQDAMRRGDADAALDYQKKFQEVIKAKMDFAKKHGVPMNTASFVNQIKQSAIQRQMPLAATRASLGGRSGIFNGSLNTHEYYNKLRGEE